MRVEVMVMNKNSLRWKGGRRGGGSLYGFCFGDKNARCSVV